MQRYKLGVQYIGSEFYGFQALHDPGRPTVQEFLEDAVKAFVGEDNCSRISTSSRTDKGVHAIRNVCHVDLMRRKRQSGEIEAPHTARTVCRALNHHLSLKTKAGIDVVAVTDVELVDMSAYHARFSATGRSYTYRILAGAAGREATYFHENLHSSDPVYRGDAGFPKFPLFERQRAWCVPEELDVQAMREAASHLIGHHDFSSFRGGNCQANSPLRTLDAIHIESAPLASTPLFAGQSTFAADQAAREATGGGVGGAAEGVDGSSNAHYSPLLLCLQPQSFELVTVTIHARSFLYHMVRNIAGALKRVGTGHITPLELQRIMEAKERRNPPKMAPAHGLYLVDVHYDPRGNQFDGRLEDVNYRGGRYGDGSEDGSDDGSDDGSGDGSGDGSDDAGAGADDGSGEASSGPPPAPNDAGGGKGEGGGEAGGEGEWNDAAILSWATGGFRLVSVGSPSEDNIMVGVEKSTGPLDV